MKENVPATVSILDSSATMPLERAGRRTFLARLAALGASAASLELFSDYVNAAESSQRAPLRDSYDYIIVGAGSAGCLLADRLSTTGASVLLVEAGSSRIAQPKVADVASWLQNLSSDTDWGLLSTPQPDLVDRPLSIPAGKILGGSGSINAMIWLRGDPRDYQRWWRTVGPDWTPKALDAAYLKVVQPAGACGADGNRITVGRYADRHPLTAAYMASSVATGLKPISLNAGKPLDGVGVAEANATPDGMRSGPAEAFLAPALVRPNLKVLTDVLVSKLILQGTTCVGIELRAGNSAARIMATRRTIVCMGACASPRLLMLSGIGPVDQLAPLGIQVRQDMPSVGSGLQDHVLLSVLFRSRSALAPQVSNGVSTMAYYGASAIAPPEIQVAGMQYPFGSSAVPAGSGYTVIPFLAKPRSRGRAQLVSADPRVPLHIDPNYLADQVDRDNMMAGLDRALEIGAGPVMREFYGSLATDMPLQTHADKQAFIAAKAACGLHLVGTCSAGADPRTSVVDGRFRVRGIEALHVVDASVIPEVPAVNVHAAVLTIAQLAAGQLNG
jgi:choline dehydrogenase